MRDSLVERLAESIAANANGPAMDSANRLAAKDDRQGRIAKILSQAAIASHVCAFRGSYYWFDGEIYVEVGKDQLSLALSNAMKLCAITDADICVRGKAIIEFCRSQIGISTIDPSKSMICFSNGVLNIDTEEFSGFGSEKHVTNKLAYNYDPNATCPRWESFLAEVLPEKEDESVLQEYLGVIFMDRSKFKLEKMLFLVGTGSNGKSVVFETITGILGPDNVSNFDLSALTTGAGSGTNAYNIASVDGKLLNYCSDIGKRETNGDGIKNLISGEPCTARQIFKEPYSARHIPPMMANANELPPTTDHSKGYFRRLILITFGVHISDDKQDTQLSIKLRNEYSGIFNWILEGRRRFIANGFKFSNSQRSKDRVAEYEIESNSILMFLCENKYAAYPVYTSQSATIKPVSELYKEYCLYCEQSNFKKFSVKAFGGKMKEKRYGSGNNGARYYEIYKMPTVDDFSWISGGGKTSMSLTEWEEVVAFRNGFDKVVKVAPEKVNREEIDNVVPF